MLIPLNTDAPVNYFPVATLCMIALNIIAFIVTGAGSRPDLVAPFILSFGNGLHPFEWITMCFMHADIFHLLGNMIFLWAFGLVVEGKLGWTKFVAIYLAMGAFQSAVEQTIMLGADRNTKKLEQLERIEELLEVELDPEEFGVELDQRPPERVPVDRDDEDDPFQQSMWQDEIDNLQDLIPGINDDDDVDEDEDDEEAERLALAKQLAKQPLMFGALGASGVIYGLLAISLVWAPKNEITVMLFLIRPYIFQMTIMFFATLYIGLDMLICIFSGLSMATEFLHSMGALTGFAVGIAMLKMDLVDCEDWDLFAVLSGNYGPHVRDRYGYRIEKDKRTKTKVKVTQEAPAQDRQLEAIIELIENDEPHAAAEDFLELKVSRPNLRLRRDHLKRLAQDLVAEKEIELAEDFLEEYIEHYGDDANWACLRLAAIQLQTERPRAALGTLKGVSRELLGEKQKALFRKIGQAAKQQVASGVQDREVEW